MSVHAKLAAARAIVGPVIKTETADAGKYEYSYASLSSVLKAVDEACNEVELAWWQEARPLEGLSWQLFTVLYDPEADEYQHFGGAINTTKADPQANGSALTYARRYSLVLLFGMNQNDDDGAMAHRAETAPTGRTPAEAEVRGIVAKMTKDDQAAFQADFREEFHSTLTALPENRHGEALKFAKFWTATDDAAKREAEATEVHT